MKREYFRKALDLSIFILSSSIFIILMTRILPYSLAKSIPIAFVNIEGFLYAIGLLLMLRLSIMNPGRIHRILFAPVPTQEPETKLYVKKDAFITVGIFIFNLLYLLVNFNKHPLNMDEGFILTMSERVLHGEVPHKDFFLLMTPGAVYINACVFKLFGSTMLVERTVTLILAALGSSIIYLFARIGLSFFFSVGVSLLFLAWEFPTWFQASYSWYAVLFSMLAFWITALTTRASAAGGKHFFVIGFVCGLSFLMKQNTGTYTFIAISLYFLTDFFVLNRESHPISYPHPKSNSLQNNGVAAFRNRSIILAVGFLVPFILTCSMYINNDSLLNYLRNIFILPFSGANDFSIPYRAMDRISDKRFVAHFPHLSILCALGTYLGGARWRSSKRRSRFLLILILATSFSYLVAFPRADFIHIAFAIWPSFILIMFWMQRHLLTLASDKPQFLRKIFLFSSQNEHYDRFLLVIPFLFLLIFFVHQTRKNLDLKDDLLEISSPKASHIYDRKEDVAELNEVIEVIKKRGGSGKQNMIFSNNPLIYFLTDCGNPTTYDYFIAGNGPKGYLTDVLGEFQESKVELVVLDADYGRYPAPPEWPHLAKHIRTNYRVFFISSNSRFELLERIPGDIKIHNGH